MTGVPFDELDQGDKILAALMIASGVLRGSDYPRALIKTENLATLMGLAIKCEMAARHGEGRESFDWDQVVTEELAQRVMDETDIRPVRLVEDVAEEVPA